MVAVSEKQAIEGLMAAYGMELQFERQMEQKRRFRGLGTFIDVWQGRKGITLGVYDNKKSAMYFQYRLTLEQIENLLLNMQRNYEE